MWMSLLPCLIARPRIEFASLMIGASSDALIRSCLVSASATSGVGGELQLADDVGLQQVDGRRTVRGRRLAALRRRLGAGAAAARLLATACA